MKKGNRCASCGLLKSHADHVFDHEFVPEEKPKWGSQRSALNPRSDRPGRVQRRQEVAQARQERREAVRYCEAPSHGIETPCGVGPDATLEASHVIGLGMGGGKEHGEIRMLCRRHHRELDTNRAEFREAGLSKKPPPPDKLPPRRGHRSAF